MATPARVTWVGHSTVLVEMDGVRIVTDPVLRRRVAHLVRAAPVPPVDLRNVDAVLISHAHFDHLDLPTLARIGSPTATVVAAGAAPIRRRRSFQRVLEVTPGDEFLVGRVSVTTTPAEHDAGLGWLLGRSSRAVGFLMAGSSRIYFAGDTGLFPGMSSLSPDLDLALLPISGWGSRLGAGHLGPLEAAQALSLLRPRLALPIHYGTYRAWFRRESSDAEARRTLEAFRRHAADQAPSVTIQALAVGETLVLDPSTAQAQPVHRSV